MNNNDNGGTNWNNDETVWDPTITFVLPTNNWVASTCFSNTEGLNQWYYKSLSGSTYSNLTYSGGYWGRPWFNSNHMHPGQSTDAVREWVAPQAGTISIAGTVKKYDIGGGNGVLAKILRNGNQLWSTTIAYNDNTVGASPDSSLGQVQVAAGDAIDFVLNNNDNGGTNWNNDETVWDPIIKYVAIPVIDPS